MGKLSVAPVQQVVEVPLAPAPVHTGELEDPAAIAARLRDSITGTGNELPAVLPIEQRQPPLPQSSHYGLPYVDRLDPKFEVKPDTWYSDHPPRGADLRARDADGNELRLSWNEVQTELTFVAADGSTHRRTARLTPGGELEELRTDAHGELLGLEAPDGLRSEASLGLLELLPPPLRDALLADLRQPPAPLLAPQRLLPSPLEPSRRVIAGLLREATRLLSSLTAETPPATREEIIAAFAPLVEEAKSQLLAQYEGRAGQGGDARQQANEQLRRARTGLGLVQAASSSAYWLSRQLEEQELDRLAGRGTPSWSSMPRALAERDDVLAGLGALEQQLTEPPLTATEAEVGVGRAPAQLPGERFDPERVLAAEGGPLVVRAPEPALRSFASATHAYLVHTTGPEAGCIYRVVPRPADEALSSLPPPEALEADLEARLRQLASDGPYSDSLTDLAVWFERLYFGIDGGVALRAARLFDLDGRGARYDALLRPLERSFTGWIRDEARRLGLPGLENLGSVQNHRFETELYSIPDRSPEPTFWDRGGALCYVHHTSTDALPGIFQLGGLEGGKLFETLAVPKLTGEGGATSRGYTGGVVSFWYHKDGVRRPGVHAHGTRRQASLPIVFAVDKRRAPELDTSDGTMNDEKVAPYLSLGQVTHVYVPHFVLDEMRELFASQGYPALTVLPFGADA